MGIQMSNSCNVCILPIYFRYGRLNSRRISAGKACSVPLGIYLTIVAFFAYL